jgi:chromosome segregation ATPase
LNITENDIAIIKTNILELEDAINNIDITNVNLDPIILDIANIKENINNVSRSLLQKIESNISEINKLKTKDTEHSNNISGIKRDILALQSEDVHIFEILNELQSINNTIFSDVDLLKENNKNINNEIRSIKEKIQYLTGVNVDSFETLEGANRRLTELENADKEFQKVIYDVNNDIKSIKEENKKTNDDLLSLKDKVENLTGIDMDSLESLKNINRRLDNLESTDIAFSKTLYEANANIESLKETNNDINQKLTELDETIKNGVNVKLQWLIL